MTEDLEFYIAGLKLNSIIYNDDISEMLEEEEIKEYVLSKEFLDMLEIRLNSNKLSDVIDDKVKDNIREVLKFIQDNNSKEELSRINKFKMYLNVASSKNQYKLYQSEFLKRVDQKETKIALGAFGEEFFKNNPDIVEHLRISMSLDYATVMDFIEVPVENMLYDPDYYDPMLLECLNIILSEKKEFYDIPGFRDKVLTILKTYKNISFKEREFDRLIRIKILMKKIKKQK